MRNVISRPVIALLFLALLMVGRSAGALDAVGWITLLDEETDQIILDDGRTFAVSDDINFSALTDGKRVRVTYETIGGVPTITRIIMLAPLTDRAESPSRDAPVSICENRTAVPDPGHPTIRMNLYC